MSDNWVVQNLQNSLDTWNKKLAEVWTLLTQSPQSFKGGHIWQIIMNIHGSLEAIGLALLVLFFVAGVGGASKTTLPKSIIKAVEECGFFESIPLWAITLIGSLFITIMSFIIILTVYGRFFKLYIYTAISPIPLSTFAGEPTQSIGISFLKSYAASPPVVNEDAAAATMVWAYVGELAFNMLVLVGAIKMSDRVVKEMMGL